MKILGESERDRWSENIGRKLVGIQFFLEIL